MENIDTLNEKKQYFDDNISNSIQYLLDTLDIDSSIPKHKIPSWMTYGYYFSSLKLIDEENFSQAKELIEKAVATYAVPETQLTITYANEHFMKSPEVALIRSIYDAPDNNEEAYLFGPFDNNLAEEENKLTTAINIIQTHLPAYYKQLVTLIPNLLITGPTQSRFITSASTVKLFGCVIIGSYGTSSIYTYLEDLIHESAHHRLFLEQAHDELILNNADEKYPAPFRTDLRPMAGLFHAHYVLGNIYQSFQSLAQLALFSNQAEFNTMRLSAKQRFFEGKATIDKHAVFTERGSVIYQTINSEVMTMAAAA